MLYFYPTHFFVFIGECGFARYTLFDQPFFPLLIILIDSATSTLFCSVPESESWAETAIYKRRRRYFNQSAFIGYEILSQLSLQPITVNFSVSLIHFRDVFPIVFWRVSL